MDLFIIGDVHGCCDTLTELLTHWKPASERLIQVGDLVDRGRYIPETVELARRLHEKHPDQTTFLKGNHELGMLRHLGPDGSYKSWLDWGGRTTMLQYDTRRELRQTHLAWLAERPLFWKNEHVLVSHAGIAKVPEPLNEDNPDGILWRRGPLLNLGVLQVVGHTPTEDGRPRFDDESRTLYIDTGAYQGKALSAVRLNDHGMVLETISIPTHPTDLISPK
ncbi:metallophosphoesterase [uncultured Hymenobacter sp.]|uniref:metallophosphoesterase n=1 Tax=uncultured Hymenobacter sp. TaxID=170016 RepID=UPI0035C99F10